tara:strand:+ start:464 stop:670 length:207 start_codon:yes stop_codon:yes gene_type:complete
MIDPISISEIADMMSKTRQQVAQLHYHGRLPKPDKVIKACPLWDINTISTFLDNGGVVDRRKNDTQEI